MLAASQVIAYTSLKKKLPLGLQSFKKIRRDGLVYIDKTALIYQLYALPQQFFLSRPRRFGKSTVVSTLEELFSHGLEPYDGHDSYFKGLEIESLWTDEDRNSGPFHIMHFDFSLLRKINPTASGFEQSLCAQLEKYAQEFGVKLNASSNSSFTKFMDLVTALDDGSLVLLIDEYDAPLTAHISAGDDAEFNAVTEILKGLFLIVKTQSDKFRFVFVTGITRFKDASIFTAGSTIQDISQDPAFGALCGITYDELLSFFPEYLKYAAASMLNLRIEEVSADNVRNFLDQMALWYDGYCFDEACSTKVFSLWSVLRFFNGSLGYFKPYWYDDGGLPEILRRSFTGGNLTLNLSQIAADDVEVEKDAFLNPASLASMDPMVLLFQSGYLTIKAPYWNSFTVKLGIPNREIADGVHRLLLSSFRENGNIGADKLMSYSTEVLAQAIANQDAENFRKAVNLFLNGIDYEHYPIKEESSAAVFISFFICSALSVTVDNNRHEALGRPDMVFDYQGTTVVIELKFTDDENQAAIDKKLSEAVDQIKDRDYGNTFRRKAKLWRIGMVYSASAKSIAAAQTADSEADNGRLVNGSA